MNITTPIIEIINENCELLRKILTTAAIIIPINPTKRIGPRLDKSLFVKYPYKLSSRNIIATIKNTAKIDSRVYAKKITDKVSPVKKLYKINRTFAVVAEIFVNSMLKTITIPSSPITKTQKKGVSIIKANNAGNQKTEYAVRAEISNPKNIHK